MRPSANPVGHARSSLEPAEPKSENILPAVPPPALPEHLGDAGAAVWFQLWDAGQGAYRPETDQYVIERYASLHDRREALLRTLERDGWVTVGSQGQDVAHPAAKLLADAEAKMTALEDRLGLNPEARIRLGIAATEHKSKLDAFMDED